jgi:hypothetical protein
MNERITTHEDLDVYQLAFKAAMAIFELSNIGIRSPVDGIQCPASGK